jgi:D-2-hydroxyacid dehydrogenase (NADP+)
MSETSESRPISTLHAYGPLAGKIGELVRAASNGTQVVVWSEEREFVDGIEGVESILLSQSPAPPTGHWHRATSLRLIQLVGAGADHLLPADGLASHVPIANVRGVQAPQMTEFALASLLALAKRFPKAMETQSAREWDRYTPRMLAGGTLGILGLGTVGAELAAKASGLGMRVIGTRRRPAPVPHVERVLPPEGTAAVLRESDAVVVLLPLTEQTRGLIDASMLRRMKPEAHLVVLSRGGIVDEAAVAAALTEQRLGGAAIDAYAREPLPADSPLWAAPNLILTSHVSAAFDGYGGEVARLFVENTRRVEAGLPVVNEVERHAGY